MSLITVYKAENLTDAYIVKGLLEGHAIECHISGIYLTGAMGELPVRDIIEIKVTGDQLHQARELLDQRETGALEINIEGD